MANQPPTIKDVAERAGVSTSLVSLVINNRPKVSPRREAMVREAMAELGYVPPPPGRRRGPKLNSHRRTNRVAMVVTSVIESILLKAPVYSELLHAVSEAVAGLGKSMTLHHHKNSELSPELATALRTSDGAVIFGPLTRGPLWREVQQRPCVRVMGGVQPDAAWDHVTYDNRAIGRLAGEHLRALGCCRVAFMHTPPSMDPLATERGRALAESLQGSDCSIMVVPSDHRFITRTEFSHGVNIPIIAATVDELLALPKPPDAFFVPGDIVASALHGVLLSRGVRPGRDVHIISVNNEGLLLSPLTPRPTTIDIHPTQIARAAVDLLSRRIRDPNMPYSVQILQPTLIPGEDLRAAAAR